MEEQNGEISIKNNPMKNMKALAQPVYHLLKDAELRKRLREHGLDCKGDRKNMTQRLKNFIVLWNSQCDLDKPMTKLEMIAKLKKEEINLVKTSLENPSTSSQFLNYDRKTDPGMLSMFSLHIKNPNCKETVDIFLSKI